MTAASERAVAQWLQAPTKRSHELSKLKTVEKSNTHQQGKSLPLLTHRKVATSVVPIHFLELTSLPPGCSQPALSKPARQASSITCWSLRMLGTPPDLTATRFLLSITAARTRRSEGGWKVSSGGFEIRNPNLCHQTPRHSGQFLMPAASQQPHGYSETYPAV